MQGAREITLDYRRKDRRKKIKTIVQCLILAAMGWLLVHAVFDIERYDEPDKSEWNNRDGFIAVSYFGVGRTGTPSLIGKDLLDRHLEALHDQGYVTVSQQDIVDFYTKGSALPDKALFLAFEDGRNDSSLFAQPLLEKYNYKATFLSYANKIGNDDRKFLQPKDMLKMMKTGYWELGTNGYRLSYINIFDKDGNYIGVKNENEFQDKEQAESFNHYLMDFIRDADTVPIEHRAEMEARIGRDYAMMDDIYSRTLGFVPQTYMIMHANYLYNGMNRLVEEANDRHIREMFSLHFNREGDLYNTAGDDRFDSTRVQPKPYWFTNHLLMKIRKDTGEPVQFVTGHRKRAERWETVSGAAEFEDGRIALTSPPGASGILYLKGSEAPAFGNVRFGAKLAGNVVGRQSVYLRYDRENDAYVRVTLHDNRLVVEQKTAGGEPEELFADTLPDLAWGGEDLALQENGVYAREEPQEADGSDIPADIRKTRALEIALTGGKLDISVDKRPIAAGLAIDGSLAAGGIAIGSGASEANEKDDIYDGVFDDIWIETAQDGARPEVLYRNSLTGAQAVASRGLKLVDRIVDWAIETF